MSLKYPKYKISFCSHYERYAIFEKTGLLSGWDELHKSYYNSVEINSIAEAELVIKSLLKKDIENYKKKNEVNGKHYAIEDFYLISDNTPIDIDQTIEDSFDQEIVEDVNYKDLFSRLARNYPSYDLNTLLNHQKILLDYLDYFDLSNTNIHRLLIKDPSLFNKLKGTIDKRKLFDVGSNDLVQLLIKRPEFLKYVNLKDLDIFYSSKLIIECPELFSEIDQSKLTTSDLIMIVKHQPQFAYMLKFDDFDEYIRGIKELCNKQPQFLERLNWKKINNSTNIDNHYNLLSLVQTRPEAVQYITCWDKVAMVYHDPYKELLKSYPYLTKYIKEDMIGENYIFGLNGEIIKRTKEIKGNDS